MQLYFLMNAKSGLCPEDCGYCSQSKVSEAEIPRYNLLSREKLLDGARLAAERGSKTYCIVISARGPNEREMQAVETIVPEIKQRYDLKICACLGLLTPDQARRLTACGVDQGEPQPQHQRRVLRRDLHDAHLPGPRRHAASGPRGGHGAVLRRHHRHGRAATATWSTWPSRCATWASNRSRSTSSTPSTARRWPQPHRLNPRYCLKVLAMFRFVNPRSELRIAGGRELHLGSLQALGLYAANSIFVGDYLTTKGQPPEADYQMIEELGFVVTRHEEVPAGHS